VRAATDAGAEVHYLSIDVNDRDALVAVVEDCVARHGRLDGIVHGAGIIEDRQLREKTAESYRRVFDTKVGGGRALIKAASAAAPGVGFVVLFGSVAGVFGNEGQVDYSAANDALDALAINAPEPLRGRVLTVDWGPWGQSGMVSEELARKYARRQIGLIDPVDGVNALIEELAHRYRVGSFATPHVVMARAVPSAFAPEREDESIRA
jgi:NAD(P)-dependent dehydrogenase (short-subunit alcohol dehydrogenase family)